MCVLQCGCAIESVSMGVFYLNLWGTAQGGRLCRFLRGHTHTHAQPSAHTHTLTHTHTHTHTHTRIHSGTHTPTHPHTATYAGCTYKPCLKNTICTKKYHMIFVTVFAKAV